MCEEGWDVESAGRVYVILVSTIIGFIGITSQVFVFWDYLGGFTPLGLTVLGTFNFCLGLLCYNYYLCCTVEPGSVPQGWEPPLHGVNVYELKRDTQ
ncbi:Palmitoyltransferase, partial [Spiromyces aspiralis]